MLLKFWHVVLLINTMPLCCSGKERFDSFYADVDFSDMMCSAEQIVFQIITRSVLACAKTCAAAPACCSFIFYRNNSTCYGLLTENPFSENIMLSGAAFYKPATSSMTTTSSPTEPQTTMEPQTTSTEPQTTSTEPQTTSTEPQTTSTEPQTTTGNQGCASSNPMVDGFTDLQLSANSHFTNLGPENARLNSSSCWSTGTNQPHIEVKFLTARVVTGVITKGCGNYVEWVTTYVVKISVDCQPETFMSVTDVHGNEQTFIGNSDQDTPVTNVIDPAQYVKCLRIYPQMHEGYKSLRFEVLGCQP